MAVGWRLEKIPVSWAVRRLWALGLALSCVPPAQALDPKLSLTQYIHSDWTENEGRPMPGVNTLAQTADGYLWLGTWRGLWRFDGLRFTKWTPPAGERAIDGIFALSPSPTGGLWVGTNHGLARLEQGRLADFSGRFGLTARLVKALWQEPGGGLWISGIQMAGPSLSFVQEKAAEVLPREEILWLSGEGRNKILAGASGAVFACSTDGGTQICEREAGESQELALLRNARTTLRDRDGNLWIGTLGHGVYLVRNGRVEHFTRSDGLSNDFVEALLEDREGNIWAGTGNGLDRFRNPQVARWSTAEGLTGDLVTLVCASRNGDVWVSSTYGGLDRIRNGRVQHTPFVSGSADPITSLFEDLNQTLWIGTTHGVLRVEGEHAHKVPVTGGTPANWVFAMAQDGKSTMWMADVTHGLVKLEHGSIVPALIPGLARDPIYQLATTRAGGVWLGFLDGGVAVWDGKAVRRFDSRSGLSPGRVQAIFEDRAGNVWVGTSEGLSRYGAGAWTTWNEAEGAPAGGVSGVIEDLAGRIWLLTLEGIAFASDGALQASTPGHPAPLALTTFGPTDNIRMRMVPGRLNPRLALAADGRIWFGTKDGLAVLDPSATRRNPVAPAVAIEDLVVDERRVRLPARQEVRGRSVELEYTALSLSTPETVRFRYMLEPVNRSWVDAGVTRRMAFAGLSPGQYQFRVTACNSDGVWNPGGASVSFVIEPRFYQTWWFAGAVASSFGLLVYLLHRGRVRLVRRHFQLVLQERTRLARDMHDTVLQGFAGVIYQLEAAARQMTSAPEVGRQRLAKALEEADRSLSDARHMLSSLRLSALEEATLPEALRSAGAKIVSSLGIRFEFTQQGRERELPYEIQANLYIIAREAMSNAANHAQADRISVVLTYSADAVSVSVQDTGKGFDPNAPESRHDHWGLAGMRERARQMGGELTIRSTQGGGTSVEITVDRLSRKKRAASGG